MEKISWNLSTPAVMMLHNKSCKNHKSIQKHSVGIINFYFPLISQEEEIPELEIDIDELLELPDEGQRSRLQVQLNHQSMFLHFFF